MGGRRILRYSSPGDVSNVHVYLKTAFRVHSNAYSNERRVEEREVYRSRLDPTYRYELRNVVSIVYVLLHVDSEGRAHEGIEEKLIVRVVLLDGRRRDGVLWLRGVLSGVASGAAC